MVGPRGHSAAVTRESMDGSRPLDLRELRVDSRAEERKEKRERPSLGGLTSRERERMKSEWLLLKGGEGDS